jgi:hypothetical protein
MAKRTLSAKQKAALAKGRAKLKAMRAAGKARRGKGKKPTKRKLLKQLREV